MEEDVCVNTIKYLYEFIDNVENQRYVQYQMFRKCVMSINRKIQEFLASNGSGNSIQSGKERNQSNIYNNNKRKILIINIYDNIQNKYKENNSEQYRKYV